VGRESLLPYFDGGEKWGEGTGG